MAVCLGEFDAMHRGHFALAERAATLGDVAMVSFSGMAEMLGWESRLPITAPSDRARVLALWSRDVEGENVFCANTRCRFQTCESSRPRLS